MYSQRKWDGFLKLDIISEININDLENKLDSKENERMRKLQSVPNPSESKELKELGEDISSIKADISNTKKYELVTKKSAVAVLVYVLDTDEFVVVEQYRPSIDGLMIEVPAGTVDDDNPKDTVKRELIEEIGLEVRNEQITTIVENIQPSPGVINEDISLYCVAVLNKQFTSEGGGLKEEGENINIIRMKYEDFMSYSFSDLKTLTLQMWAKSSLDEMF